MHDGHDHGPIPPSTTTYPEYLVDGPNKIYNYSYQPSTISIKDGNWFDSTVWSNGVPTDSTKVQINHKVTISPITVNGDLNGDGIVDSNDYDAWDRETLSDIIRFADVYFGKAVPLPGNAVAYSCLISPEGCLDILEEGSLTVCTLQALGCFELLGGTLIFCDCPWDYFKDAMQWGHGYLGLSGSETITRGGSIYSANPTGVRGHFAILHSGSLDSESTLYNHIGRTKVGPLDNTQLEADGITPKHVGTNQMARYGGPHLHHCWGNVRIVDCDITNGSKWGITIHQAHFGFYDNNRIDNCGGAGLAVEDGPEYGNIISNNVASNIFGDGLGEQGHNAGRNVEDIGTGTPEDPYRTTGSHGNHGVGFWYRGIQNDIINNTAINCPIGHSGWVRFNINRFRPVFRGDVPSQYVPASIADQENFVFRSNKSVNCKIGYAFQGLSVLKATDCIAEKTYYALNASYNSTLIFDGGSFQATRSAFAKLGFTGRLELYNLFIDSPVAVTSGEDFYLKNIKTTGDISKFYEKIQSEQRTIIMDNVEARNIFYKLGDYFNKRSYTVPEPVLLLNHGPNKENYQLWLDQQHPDYVMPNTESNRGRRQSPEAGLTNQQLWDKYKLCLAGKLMPADAYNIPGVNCKVTAIQEDLTPPQTVTSTAAPSKSDATIQVTSDKPCYAQLEWNKGSITVEGYAIMQPATTEMSTTHTFYINPLLANTKYGYLVRLTDEYGNAGGDMKSSGLTYNVRTFYTLK